MAARLPKDRLTDQERDILYKRKVQDISITKLAKEYGIENNTMRRKLLHAKARRRIIWLRKIKVITGINEYETLNHYKSIVGCFVDDRLDGVILYILHENSIDPKV